MYKMHKILIILFILLFTGCASQNTNSLYHNDDYIGKDGKICEYYQGNHYDLYVNEVNDYVENYFIDDSNYCNEYDLRHIVQEDFDTMTIVYLEERGLDFVLSTWGSVRRLFYMVPQPYLRLRPFSNFRPSGWDGVSAIARFIEHHDISKEEFMEANDYYREWMTPSSEMPNDITAGRYISEEFEVFPADLIFTFNHELIFEYFLRVNSPAYGDFGMYAYLQHHNHLYEGGIGWISEPSQIFRRHFYHMPPPFYNLVGRVEFIDWNRNRSEEERTTENIAVSFIRYFNVSKEDFRIANDEWHYYWHSGNILNRFVGYPTLRWSAYEKYPVDLLFSFDYEAINEYFKWINSPAITDFGLGVERGNFRLLHYNMPAPFLELVGRERFINWRSNRTQDEIENENIALSFIRYFDITKEEFMYANDKFIRLTRDFNTAPILSGTDEDGYYFRVSNILTFPRGPFHGTRFEPYPVDLIFSFNNEAINEFFRWENSPSVFDFGKGMKIGQFRRLHYNMPSTFADLVGMKVFAEWRNNRSEYERANENIAVSFIRYFEISKEDFIAANDEFLEILGPTACITVNGTRFEPYPIDLIFTFDNEAINEFFRWENSPAEHERDWGAS